MRAAVLTILVSYELLAQAPQPDPLMLEHNRALQLADQGHESEALEIILGVIKRAPLFQPAYKSLPDLADRAGKRPETLKGLRALVRSGPKYAGVWLGVARLSSDTASRVDAYFRCARDAPEAWGCFDSLAGAFKQSLHGRLAISDLERRLGHLLATPNDHLLLARFYEVNGHIRQAIEELARAQGAGEDLPRKAHIEYVLGTCYVGSKDTGAEAGAHFRRAAEIASEAQDWPFAIGALIDDALVAKDEQAALGQRALELARDHQMPSIEAGALYSLGMHYLHDGRPEDALAVAQRGLEVAGKLRLPRDHANLLVLCARVYRLQGDHQRGIAALEEARRYAAQANDVYTLSTVLRSLGVEYESLGDRVKMIELPGRIRIEAAVRAYRAAVEKREQPAGWETAARRLYGMLLAPAVGVLGGAYRLVIVPDGILYYLPFEALLDRSRYLLEDFSIAYSPSATAYSLMRRARRERPRTAERELLAFGDSQFRAGGRRFNVEGPALVRSIYRSTGFTFPPLPNSRTEVVAIAKLFPESLERTYLGVSATKSGLFSEKLDSYRCLHFATHAMLDERTPAQCGIALTPDGSKGDDGILRMNEIVDMKLNADLVVLSACQTGLETLVRGEGMIGLTRAFLYAGAGSVVVSLWRVDDLATSRLMQKFYKHMQEGADIASALRQAKRDMLGSGIPAYRNPYFWAPFVVTGAF